MGKRITRGALALDAYLAIISLARGFFRTILAKGGKLKLALIGVFYSQKERTRLFYYLKKIARQRLGWRLNFGFTDLVSTQTLPACQNVP